jgi:hypothetical protein
MAQVPKAGHRFHLAKRLLDKLAFPLIDGIRWRSGGPPIDRTPAMPAPGCCATYDVAPSCADS